MIFSPESNQGPLAGIFFTGPLGFIVGGLLGFIIGCIRVRRQTVKEQAGA
jgi:F0F1-type ATP synthase assembly protein I